MVADIKGDILQSLLIFITQNNISMVLLITAWERVHQLHVFILLSLSDIQIENKQRRRKSHKITILIARVNHGCFVLMGKAWVYEWTRYQRSYVLFDRDVVWLTKELPTIKTTLVLRLNIQNLSVKKKNTGPSGRVALGLQRWDNYGV